MQKRRLARFFRGALTLVCALAAWLIIAVLIGFLLFKLKLKVSEDSVFLISITVGGFCSLGIGNVVFKLASKGLSVGKTSNRRQGE